jgi:hypothetical protein
MNDLFDISEWKEALSKEVDNKERIVKYYNIFRREILEDKIDETIENEIEPIEKIDETIENDIEPIEKIDAEIETNETELVEKQDEKIESKKYVEEINFKFMECEEFVDELNSIKLKLLIIHFKTESEKSLNINHDVIEIASLNDWNNAYKKLKELDISIYGGIYCILDEVHGKQLESMLSTPKEDEMIISSNKDIQENLDRAISKYFKSNIKGTDNSYCDSGEWYPELLKSPFRGCFKVGLAMDENTYPLDVVFFIIGFSNIRNYWIRVGTKNENVVDLLKTAELYTLKSR